MDTLRTPDDRFAALPGFEHPPSYAEVPDGDGGTLRMAYVEAGPADGPVVLLLHGEPTWSFLYRHVIGCSPTPASGPSRRTWSGFGRSDKPTRPADHSYARHVEWVRALVFDVLDLRDVTLVGQDWGGLIGLRLVAEHPDRFAARGRREHRPAHRRRRRCPTSGGGSGAPSSGPSVSTSAGSSRPAACTPMDDAVRAAYDAPFPDEAFKAGPRAMPTLVPTAPDDPATEANRAAWRGAGRLASGRSWSPSATATRSPARWRRC